MIRESSTINRLLWLNTVVLLFTVSGCFAPVNLTYDNARMLKKNEMKVQAGISNYYGPRIDLSDNDLVDNNIHYTTNYGIQVAYGLASKINLGIRYEYMDIKRQQVDILFKSLDMKNTTLHYVELGCKIKLYENKLSLVVPFGVYFWEGESFSMIDPRIYYTFRSSDIFEFTVATKAHILIADGVGFAPGFSLGMGISNNPDRWAFRPEIGFDGCMSFGFGIDYRFNRPRQ